MDANILELWQLNTLIEIMLKKEAEEIGNELKRRHNDFLESKEACDEWEKYVDESRTNKFHKIGKVTITLNKLTTMRDSYSEKAYAVLREVEEEIEQEAGHACPDSPDRHCHYFTSAQEDGFFVSLLDGTRFKMDGYTDDLCDTENDDHCLFCGQPEERK